MTAIRTLLVDDETLARRGLRQHLAAHPDVEVIGECANGREALASIDTLEPDLVFLDIQMPELDGFAVMRDAIATRGAHRMPVTVFLTAYEEFALGAFDVEAIDYLVKPVTDDRFNSAMQRVRRRLLRDPSAAQTTGAIEETSARSERHLLIPTASGHRIVRFEEIDWIGAEDYYAAVHSAGRRFLLRETMASLETRLDPVIFLRVHRAAIVNVTRVRQLRSVDGDTIVVLRDGTRLPVSRRRRAALVSALS